MTLPDPYRGHAQPSWDTRTLAALITALGGVGGAAPAAAGHNHDSRYDPRYAPSAGTYFCDVENGDGVGTITAIPNTAFTRINVAGSVWANPGGGWDSATDIYTCPVAGTYLCQALVRITDGFGTNCNVGLGIASAEGDGSWFQWNKYVTGSGGRCSFDYTRIMGCSAGQQLRLYGFQDSGVTMNITRAGMQIWRIG